MRFAMPRSAADQNELSQHLGLETTMTGWDNFRSASMSIEHYYLCFTRIPCYLIICIKYLYLITNFYFLNAHVV